MDTRSLNRRGALMLIIVLVVFVAFHQWVAAVSLMIGSYCGVCMGLGQCCDTPTKTDKQIEV